MRQMRIGTGLLEIKRLLKISLRRKRGSLICTKRIGRVEMKAKMWISVIFGLPANFLRNYQMILII